MTLTPIRSGRNAARNATKIRRSTGMSKNAFAKAVGISPSTQRLIEAKYDANDRYSPSMATVLKLARAMEVSVEELLAGTIQ